MPRSPEISQTTDSLAEARRFLIGTIARTSLMYAILEAEHARISIPNKEQLKKYLAYFNYKVYLHKTYKNFMDVWQQEKGIIRGKILFRLKLLSSHLRRTGGKEQLINNEIINPLAEIYTKIEKQKPNPLQPWLGELMIKAANNRQTTEEVYSHLLKYGLDPKILVEEVYQALDRKPKKELR